MLSLGVCQLPSPERLSTFCQSRVDSAPGVPGLGQEWRYVFTCGPSHWRAGGTQSRKGQSHQPAHPRGKLCGRKEMEEQAVFVLGASRATHLTLRAMLSPPI